MKFSLILPVYNVEKYLAKCIKSCISQNISFNEYEVIIVIDGSTDKSTEIAYNYSKQYKFIRIIQQENNGLSSARNTGLKSAKGEYIWFIDSDDFIELNILSGIYYELKKYDLDCIWIRWRNIDPKLGILPLYDNSIRKESHKIYNGRNFMAYILGNYLYAWSFVWKKDFLDKNNLFFKERFYYEDSEFAFRALPLVLRIKLYNHVCYNYLVNREGSIVNTFTETKFKDICYNAITAYNLSKNECDENVRLFYIRCYSSFILLAVKQAIIQSQITWIDYLYKIKGENHLSKVRLIGNLKTKMLAVLHNLRGDKLGYNVYKFLNKHR